MLDDSASFWSEIKTLDAILTENPDSLFFAKLSSIYLKVGLVDDAVHCATQGVLKHPRYLAGLRALAMACNAKGLKDECRCALESFTEALPEDTEATKMLTKIYLQNGNIDAAKNCLQTILDFYPDDIDARLELTRLSSTTAEISEDDEFIEELDETDILELDDADLITDNTSAEDDTNAYFDSTTNEVQSVDETPAPHTDPLSTVTLAELYVKQGFIEKALIIYRALLADNPNNREVAMRIQELESPTDSDTLEETKSEQFSQSAKEPETEIAATTSAFTEFKDFSPPPILETTAIPVSGTADNRLGTLNTWLENIRRIRACH